MCPTEARVHSFVLFLAMLLLPDCKHPKVVRHSLMRIARDFSASGHDLQSLLYNFLDELLFVFHTEMLVCRHVAVTHLDRDNWSIQAHG